MALVGYVAALLSALCNGSFAAMSKLVPEQHPFVFNALLGFGVLLSSLLLEFLLLPLVAPGRCVPMRISCGLCAMQSRNHAFSSL